LQRIVKILEIFSPPKSYVNIVLSKLSGRLGLARNEWLPFYLPMFHRLSRTESSVRKRFSEIAQRYDVIFFVQCQPMWWLDWNDRQRSVLDIDVLRYPGLALGKSKQSIGLLRTISRSLLHGNMRRAELSSVSQSAYALVCSEDDSLVLSRDNVRVVPNVFPDSGQSEREVHKGGDKTILFLGTTTYKENRIGLEYFINEVLPYIRDSDNEVVLRVVGRTAPNARYPWMDCPGVDFVGTVDDTRPYIEDAAFTICPVLDGSGTRIKIIESLSYGKPVVSTTIGAYGIDLGESEGLFRIDNPKETADLCLELVRDPSRRRILGNRGKDGVALEYSQKTVNSLISKLLDNISVRTYSGLTQ